MWSCSLMKCKTRTVVHLHLCFSGVLFSSAFSVHVLQVTSVFRTASVVFCVVYPNHNVAPKFGPKRYDFHFAFVHPLPRFWFCLWRVTFVCKYLELNIQCSKNYFKLWFFFLIREKSHVNQSHSTKTYSTSTMVKFHGKVILEQGIQRLLCYVSKSVFVG